MITASDIFSKIRSRLDDDNSGRYDIPNDLVPATNASISFWVSVLNAGFESKRLYHERLSELIRNKIYTATVSGNTAYVDVSADREAIWSVFGVDPQPVTGGVPEVLIESRNKWATRLTLKEWNDASDDPFSPGSLQSVPSQFVRAGFIAMGGYKGDANTYIKVRPASVLGVDKKLAIWYLKNPVPVVDGTSTIEFPVSMAELIVNKAVNYISFQHGVQSAYYQFTERDIAQLAQILNA